MAYLTFGPCSEFLARCKLPKSAKKPKDSFYVEAGRDGLGVLGALGGQTPEQFNCGWDHEERAALIEFDGHVAGAWAEAIAQLDPRSPLPGISNERWLLFIDDCGHFVDAGWAERAVQLGWGPIELFGCDRDHSPCIAHGGLVWQLSGRRLIALSAETAIVLCQDTSKLIFKRSRSKIGSCLIWEITHFGKNVFSRF